MSGETALGMRLDKWLWAARFYKTRQLAVEAINGGHVHLQGRRTKPGRDIQAGARLQISKAGLQWDIEVLQLPKQRRPAAEAVAFFRETDASRQERERRIEALRLAQDTAPVQTASKPNKRDRRMIHRFKQQSDG